jgi:ATP-binding cassette subfamily B protein
MKLLFKFLAPYRWYLALALGLAAINQLFSLLDPQLFRIVIDRYASRVGQIPVSEFMHGVIFWIGLAIGAAFVSRVAKNFQDYFVSLVTQRVSTELYEHSVAHAFSLPYARFEDQRSGEILQKLQKARTDAQVLITNFVNTVFLAAIGILFVTIYAFIVDWRAGLGYTLLIPILAFTTFLLTRRIKLLQKTIVARTADLAGSTTETLRNVELVKSLGLEDQEVKRLNTVNTQILGLELSKIKAVRALSFIQGTFVNASRSGLIVLFWFLVASGRMTLGELFSLLFYSFFVFGPLGELGNVSTQYQEARASFEQLDAILSLPAEEKPSDAKDPGEAREIEFNHVDFVYEGENRLALEDISLTISAGQSVAFVGPSGSGKSTLVKLLVGLYAPTKGEIKFNDIPSTQIDFDLIRQRIGFVSQETQLFAGTIKDNLLFVRPQASDAECMSALKAAAVSHIIERSPEGLDTRIGEGGIKLSGGERQRLAIARALLREPEMLIFDEATSSLDSLTEKEITETIKTITEGYPGLITVLIAHRLSTISHADIIYVLAQGHIVESGKHAKLLEGQGLYAALWKEQGAAL